MTSQASDPSDTRGTPSGEQPDAAPRPTSRGRIIAALALCLLAAAGLAANYIASVRVASAVQATRDQQARMDVFTGRVAMRLAYYLDGLSQDEALAQANREFARTYARTGFKSAAGYFEKATSEFRGVDDKTAAAASAAGLYSAAGDDWRAVLALQATMQGVPVSGAATPPSARESAPKVALPPLTERGRTAILFPLLRMYANERPRPELLRSAAFKWIERHAAAHLLVESQINERLGRADRAAKLRAAMYDVGERIATRIEIFLALSVVLIVLGLALLAWGAFSRRGLGPYRGLPPRPWGPWEGLALVGLWLVVYLVISALAQVEPGRPGFAAGVLASYVLASVIALAWFARSVAPRGSGLTTAGWLRASPVTSIANGVGAYVAVFPIFAATSLLAVRLLPPSPPNAVIVALTQAPGWGDRVWFLLLLCIAAPVVEETVFRGAVYGAFRTRWSLPLAALASSALFAAVHVNLQSFVPIVALGVGLCVVYERTRSLLPGMVAHSLFNLATVIVVLALA